MLASKVACPSCQTSLKADRPLPAGLKVKCPRCGTPFTVPGTNGVGHAANGHGIAPAQALNGHGPPAGIQPPHMLPPAAAAPTAGIVVAMPPTPSLAPTQPRNNLLIAALAVGGFAFFMVLGGVVLWLCVALASGPQAPPQSADTPAAPPSTSSAVKPRPKPLIVLPPEQQQKVDTATKNGVAYLKKVQQPNGSWQGPGHAGQDPVGYTSLASLALIECNVPKEDPAIQKAAAFVRNTCPTLTGTYPLSLAILFLHHLGDTQDEALLRELGLRLAHGQTPQGGWSYTCRLLTKGEQEDFRKVLEALSKETPEELLKKPNLVAPTLRSLAVLQKQEGWPDEFYRGGGDNSNTQFALLALLAARRHDLNLDPSLALIARRFRATQNGDGSWNYAGRANVVPYPTMTCCGLLGVAIEHGLVKDGRKGQRPEKDPAVQKALEHVSKHVGEPMSRNSKAPLSMFQMYYLWCVERVGVLYRLRDIKGKPWFEWGMNILVQNQHEDGSWPYDGGHGNTTVNTCFALLFLQRVDLAEDLTNKIRELAELPVWRDDAEPPSS